MRASIHTKRSRFVFTSARMTGIATLVNPSAGSNRSFSIEFNSSLLKRSQIGTLPSLCFSDTGLLRGFYAARK
jgi:hypothetical protein